MKTVSINDLQKNTFVRRELDQDHVLYLGQLLEGGVKLPPILVTDDLQVIDGRHRIEAHELLNLTEIRCEVVEVRDEADLIARAFKANVGGPKPPTPEDVEHTVKLLLARGVAQKDIVRMLRLPPGMARHYVGQVKSKLNRARLLQAASSVTDDGLTVAKAAEKHNVDSDKLREVLSGRRNRHKPGIAEIQRTLTRQYKSVGLRNANLCKRLMDKLEDGDVTEKQVISIFDHLDSLQKQSARAVADWRKRFDTLRGKEQTPSQPKDARDAKPAKSGSAFALRKMGLVV